MSPFKRTQRATAKQRAGRQRKPLQSPPVAWPQARSSAAWLSADPSRPMAEIPSELAGPDYAFRRVELPDVRPLVSPGELRAALDDEDDTPTQPITGVIVPEQPQPAAAPGLEPAQPSAPQAAVHVGNALPARLTAWERDLLGGDATMIPDAHFLPADPWAAWERELADVWADTERRFAELDRFVQRKSEFDDGVMRRWSEDMRVRLVGGDLHDAERRMHRVYAEGGTGELTGLAASLAAMIVRNAKAQPAGATA